jgi:hypothetical protein
MARKARQRFNVIHNAAELARLSPQQRDAWSRAISIPNEMRSHPDKRFSDLAAEKGLSRSTARSLLGSSLTLDRTGRLQPRRFDRLYRGEMQLLTPDGRITVEVRDSRTATRLAQHASAVRRYVETGDDRALRRLRSKSVQIGGKKLDLLTDTRQIDRLAHAGEVSYESLYKLAA